MGVVSLSVFGGNFVLAKVSVGLISVPVVRSSAVSAFSGRFEIYSFYDKINRGQVICPLQRGSPLFNMRGGVIEVNCFCCCKG